MTLQKGEPVLGIRFVTHQDESKIIVTRWQNGRRVMSYEPLPFRPYCFVRQRDVKKLDLSSIFNANLEETDFKTTRSANDPGGDYVVKLSVSIPQDINTVQDLNPSIKFYEGDVPFGKRVFVDMDLNLPEEYKPAYCDIETDPRNVTNKSMAEAKHQVLSAAIVSPNGDRFFLCDDSEGMLFQELNKQLQNYTCMVSWSDFDFNYLSTRGRLLKLKVPYVTGIEGVDMMYYFNQVVMKSFTGANYLKLIKAVAKMRELGAKVDKMPDLGVKEDYSLVYKYFKEDRAKLEAYNIADSVAMQQMDQELQLTHSMYELMRVIKIFPREFRLHSKIDDYLKLRIARLRGEVLPSRPKQHYDTRKLAAEPDKKGAYVFEPIPGYHENIFVLDFGSMYPSIMRSLNIGVDSQVESGGFKNSENAFRTPNGRYYSKEKLCINSQYLDYVQQYFEKYDAELQKAQPETLQYARAFAKRLKMKLVKNADFGIVGYKTGRLYDKDTFESITYTGQALIQIASAIVNIKGYPTIYGDTDSIFLKTDRFEPNEIADLLEFLNEELKAISLKMFGAEIDTEIDLDYFADKSYFTSAKKRYVMHVINQDWKDCDYIKIMGFETQRRDWVDLSKKVQKMLFNELLKGKSAKQLENELRPYFNQLKQDLFAGKLDEQIVFTKGIKQELEKYATSLPHTRAAKILQEKGMYNTGADVEYFVISHDKVKSVKMQDGKPVIGKKGKPLTQSKLFIDVYPNIPDRPKIRRSGYSYVWQSQVMAILNRVGMYENDETMLLDPEIKTLEQWWLTKRLTRNWTVMQMLHRGLSK